METSELLCEIRPTTPKGARHQVRREGRVPGVLYGPKTTPMAVSVNALDLKNRVAHAASARIMRLKSPSLVRWKCTGGSSPDWIGTTQEFRLEPQADGEVLVKFCHGGWKSGGDHCYYCNTTWGHLLVALKDYCEHGVKNPYFT